MERGGFKRGGFPIWTCPSFFVPWLSFLGLPRFFRNFPDLSGDSSGLYRPINSAYEEQSRKGPRHNLDLSRKKVGNPRFGNPGLASPKHMTGRPADHTMEMNGGSCIVRHTHPLHISVCLSGGVRVGFRVRFQVVKVPIAGGFPVENPTEKANRLKALLRGISLSEYGSKGSRVRLRGLSEYGSLAYLVERPTWETRAEQYSDTVLSPCLCLLFKGLLVFQGRSGITSVVGWSLRTVQFRCRLWFPPRNAAKCS